MARNVSFNSNALQTFNGVSGVIVKVIDHLTSPDNTINLLPLAKAPRSTITSALKQQKVIKISGTVVGSTIADLDNQYDIFKGHLVGADKNLDIDYNGSTRRYVATVNKTIPKPSDELNWRDFETDLICSQPYGLDTSAATWVNQSGRTLASYSDGITIGGDAEWQTPVITITLTAVTGGTNASITIGNALIGQQCAITRNWSNGDILLIDTSDINNPVTVNGTAAVFTGALPTFNPTNFVSSQTITYIDTFTTRTMTESVTNLNKWE